LKPIHLNLASRPYRDYRPLYAVVVLMSLLTAFLMLKNIDTFYRYKRETKSTTLRIEQLEAAAEQERRHEEIVRHRVQTLDLKRLDQQTKFINAKLEERAFSWSVLLDELESVLADDVRLIAVAPTFQEDGTVSLMLQFHSKSYDGMTKTIDRMNGDPQFHSPFPGVESQIEGGYAFDLRVQYLPQSAGADALAAKNKGAAR
jgi:hypothetical protein